MNWGQIMTSQSLDEWCWVMFEPTLTLPNFTLGKLSVVKKPIVDGGAIRPGGLLLLFNLIQTGVYKKILKISMAQFLWYDCTFKKAMYRPCDLDLWRSLTGHAHTDRQAGWKQYLATPSGGEVNSINASATSIFHVWTNTSSYQHTQII